MPTDEDALRTVNRSFYGAIESADVAAMRRLWSPEQVITCVHPRCQLIAGWDEVIESWRIIFDEIAPWQISVEEQRLSVQGDLGCVICLERYELGPEDDDEDGEGEDGEEHDDDAEAEVLAAAEHPAAAELSATEADPEEDATAEASLQDEDDAEDEDEPEDDGIRLVVATHIFVREDGQWRLAHRHASPYTEEGSRPGDLLN